MVDEPNQLYIVEARRHSLAELDDIVGVAQTELERSVVALISIVNSNIHFQSLMWVHFDMNIHPSKPDVKPLPAISHSQHTFEIYHSSVSLFDDSI